MGDSSFDLNKKNETITIAGKSILKWVKLQSLVANCGKMMKRAGKITIFELKVVIFTARNTNIYKICELRRAIFSSFYNI
jgi:hypothetical protein